MKYFFIILGVLLSITSCGVEKEDQNNPIFKKWSLIKFEPGFSPTKSFDSKEIIWEFQENGKLKININVSISKPPIKPTGEYQFLLEGNRIIIEGVEYGFTIHNDALIISDDPSADGFRATYSAIK